MNSRLVIFLISLFSCYLPEASSQSSNIIKIGYDAGFRSINVRKILKDKFGFIWVGTQDGLYRYDANEFELFKNNFDGRSLGNNFIIDFVYDGNNYLYVSTYEGGLDRINITDLHIENLVTRNRAGAWPAFSTLGKLALSNDIAVVYNMYGLSAYNIKQLSFTKLNMAEITTSGKLVENVFFLDDSSLAITCTDNSVCFVKMINNGNLIYLKKIAAVTLSSVKSIKTIDEKIYLLTNTALYTLNEKYALVPVSTVPAGLQDTDVTDFSVEGTYLFTASSAGVLQSPLNMIPANQKKITPLPGTENELVNCLYKDNQQILWIGTYNGLLQWKLNKQKFIPFAGSYNLKDPHLYTLLKDKEWMYACATNNLYKVNLISKDYFIVTGASNLGLIHHIIDNDADHKIVSTNKGMALLSTSTDELSVTKFNARYPEWKDFTNIYFNSSITINDKVYWASENHNGLIVWDRKAKTVKQILTNGLDTSDFQIHNLRTDREGHLWLLCNTAVYQVNTTQEKIIKKVSFSNKKETFNTPIYFDFYDDGNSYWFATYGGGLNKYNYKTGKWQYITEKDGLSNNCVYSILPDEAGNLWTSTNFGISMISPSGKVTSYTTEDGLQHNVFEEKSYFKDKDTLYLGGLNGFTKIIPGPGENMDTIKNPIIRRIEYHTRNSTAYTDNLTHNMNRFPSGTNSLRITVSIPDFLYRKKYQLFFNINNDGEFLKLENNAIIALNNLTGKAYKISLKIIDPSNNEKIIDNFYSFSIKPKWHETLFFELLVIGLISGMLYGLYRFRINQLKKVIAVRKKIASDLHDDLGGTLNSIRLYSHLAKVENKPEHLERINENTKEAVSGLKDLIWTLDDDKNTLSHLKEKITSYAEPVLKANSIRLDINCMTACGDIFLQKEEKRNLYLILKEAVTNSIKYAACSTVKINMECKGEKPAITYADDGKGFDISITTQGNGLKNMLQRADDISYKLQYTSTAGVIKGFILKRK